MFVWACCRITAQTGVPAHVRARYLCHNEGIPMTWVKPQFEVVALCMEITTYAHSR
ncbi:MAG: pyrroloquinoline quinone precursor peptide PqqA [Gemmatimonadetes bacterium]|nr:pyrroloquinoline quinone precursor peptide PqqA [Gemmatimonadota bacterium]